MKNQLHILVLSSWYPTKSHPFLGNFVKRHIELIAGQHKVTVLNIQSDPGISAIEITETTNGNLTEILVQYPASRWFFGRWSNAKKAFSKGIKRIENIDLIHGNVILSKGLQFIWAKNHFKKPLIITEHASYFNKETSSKWSWKEKITIDKVMQHAGLITAVSPFLKKEIQALFPLKEVKILPNVIDPAVFSLKLKQKNAVTKFVHVSTLDERYKNVSGILSACEALKKELGSVFQLQIISDEPYENWQSQVKEQKLDDCVFFSGPMNPGEIAQELQASDALVLFSSYETFSCVIAESWATGTPVISTPVGIAQSMDPEAGIQVAVNDVEALSAAMKSFIEGNVQFDQEKIRNKALAYFPEEVLKVINQVYSETLTFNP